MSKLTESQQMAVEAKDARILVSAGAGSGKTRVLVERICHLVQERGVSANRILALTFTDQAALEMKQRVEQKLGHTDATILTFHRFCGRIVRENPLLADVDPAFALIDEATARQLLRDLVNRLIYDSGFSNVLQWVETCGLDESSELLLTLYEQWRERPWDIDFLREKTETAIEAYRTVQWEEVKTVINRLKRLHHSGTVTAAGTVSRMRTILSAWEQFPQTDWHSPASCQTSASPESERVIRAIFSEVSRNVAKEAKPLFEQLAVWKNERLWKELLKDQTDAIRQEFLTLLELLDSAYRQLKEEHGWCDFADLQRKAYHVLRQSQVTRAKYGKLYNHILVDEFQDTSPIQQSVLELLEEGAQGETSLFMVGDMRQSIYRFRGADVRGFERVRNQLGESDAYIQLRENFRSCASLVAFVSDMTKTLFGDKGAIAGIEVPVDEEPIIELLIPVLDGEEDTRQAEADMVAKRILETGHAMWGHIAILLQTRTHLAKYLKALEKYGIPYVVYEDRGYWERQEVQDLYHLLRLVENPGNDLALLGYLRGPLVGLTDNGLWRLAENVGLGKGFLNFDAGAESQLSDEDKARLAKAYDLLLWLRTRYDEMGLADWIYAVLYEEGIAERLGGASFDRIVRMAEESEKRGEIHLSDLLAWWDRVIEQNEKDGDSGSHFPKGAVRIMTIHAAKGLQFPIVFVPDLTHRFTTGMGRLHLSDAWGLTAKYYDENEKSWRPSLSYAKAVEEEKTAMTSEQMRLFYVAVTRAQERLILSGAASAFSEKESLQECSNWFDWLPFLIPELREGGLRQGIIEGNGWKLRIRNDIPVVPRVRFREEHGNDNLRDGLVHRKDGDGQIGLQTTRFTASPNLIHSSGKVNLSRLSQSSRLWSVTDWVDLLSGEKASDSCSPIRIGRRNNRQATLEGHEWGHVLHSVLEHLRRDDDMETIHSRHLKAALASMGITGSNVAELAWERLGRDIETYLNSDIHAECRKASTAYSELPFAVRLFGEEFGLLLNGVIDKVWLRSDGGATVVDFKTHGCRSQKEVQQVIQRYTPQVQLYVHVVEKLLGWNVDRAGLYLTSKGTFVEVPSDQGERERLLERMYWMGRRKWK
ncbi:UvrD-helicase domain-containing protein [Effusibacillus consociatus]|uniref:DNA 3'-5' helicase n=1 Tax=Effusibacillus consociatus TaxID=1117041 RepID=A0ABV9Q4X8_9BACL